MHGASRRRRSRERAPEVLPAEPCVLALELDLPDAPEHLGTLRPGRTVLELILERPQRTVTVARRVVGLGRGQAPTPERS